MKQAAVDYSIERAPESSEVERIGTSKGRVIKPARLSLSLRSGDRARRNVNTPDFVTAFRKKQAVISGAHPTSRTLPRMSPFSASKTKTDWGR
jgi:hypothetical protein